MGFDYFYGRGTEPFAFYQVPKMLITDDQFADITIDAKLLYSLMLDRSSLSAKNGWLDEDGKVYIYYTLEQIMADMHCANQKATRLLKELETKAGLIERQRLGLGRPARIYVKDFTTGLHGDRNRKDQTHENRESRDVKITSLDSWKSCTNKFFVSSGCNTDPCAGQLLVCQRVRAINQVKRQINPRLCIEGILITMVAARTNYAKDISKLIRDTYRDDINVFETEIPRSVRAAETSAEGKSIFAHDPSGKVAEAYLYDEFCRWCI